MTQTDCEDEMLTIVCGEEDGEWLSGLPEGCVDPDKAAMVYSWQQNFVIG